MALRTFVDQAGNEWQAFDVVPRADERRHYDRRSVGAQVEEESDDRRDADRRLTVGGRSRLASVTTGWLCFEHGTDRRRLSPIPNDWRTCSDAQLEAYCREARPARLPVASEEQAAGRKK